MQMVSERLSGVIGQEAVLARNIINVTLQDIPPLLHYALGNLVADHQGPRHIVVRDAKVRPFDGVALNGMEGSPHIVVILASSHPENTLRDLRQVLRKHPHALPLVLALKCDADDAARLIRVGARGYLTITEPPGEFTHAIATIAGGSVFVPPSLQESFATRYLCPADDLPESRLTSRELSVLRLLAEGMCNKAIAANLFISVKTVDTHRMNLMRKLGLRTNVDVVRFAIRRELITL